MVSYVYVIVYIVSHSLLTAVAGDECFVIGNATVLDFMHQSSLNTQEPMTLLCCQLLSL